MLITLYDVDNQIYINDKYYLKIHKCYFVY